MFYKAPSILKGLFPGLTWQVDTNEKVVYLTFDDGPDPEATPFVLNELEKYNMRGTFFCIGDNVQKHPKLFSEIISRGHAVANHTYHHVNGWKTKPDEYLAELAKCKELVPGKWFRPPYGRITLKQSKLVEVEFNIIMWSLLSWDFKPGINRLKSLKRLKQYTTQGSIVVFHDSKKAHPNLRAILPYYLSFLHENGYKSRIFK